MRTASVGRSCCIEIVIFLCDENKNVLSYALIKRMFSLYKTFFHFISILFDRL